MAAPLKHARLRLVSFDEGGVRGRPESLRLVCRVESGGKIAVWGNDGDTKNITAILKAGLPCVVECQYRQPRPDFVERFDHRYWVRQDCRLTILRDAKPGASGSSAASIESETVGDYFRANREPAGRAAVTSQSWLEEVPGRFRLNTPTGSLVLLSSELMTTVRSLARRGDTGQLHESTPWSDSATLDDEVDRLLDSGDGAVGGYADEFDAFRGAAAWPGLSADDAESADFEDSVGDSGDPDVSGDEDEDDFEH